MNNIENKVVIITGVSSGIGEETAKALVTLAKKKFGKVDALFANAGIMPVEICLN